MSYFDSSRRNYCSWIKNCWKSYNRGMLLIFCCQKKKGLCVKNVLIKSVDDTNLRNTVSTWKIVKQKIRKKLIMWLHGERYQENIMMLQWVGNASVLLKFKINCGWIQTMAFAIFLDDCNGKRFSFQCPFYPLRCDISV